MSEKLGGVVVNVEKLAQELGLALGGNKSETKEVVISAQVKGAEAFVKDVKKVVEAQELMDKVQKQTKTGKQNYFTSLETALEHVKTSYQELIKVQQQGLGQREITRTTGQFVRWANVVQALGGTMEDIQKALPKGVDVAGILSGHDADTKGASIKYSVDAFRDLFDVLQQLREMMTDDAFTEYMKKIQKDTQGIGIAFTQTADDVQKASQGIKQSIKGIRDSKPKVEVKPDDIFDADEVQKRIQKIKEELKRVSELSKEDFQSEFKKKGARTELSRLYNELDQYYSQISEEIGADVKEHWNKILDRLLRELSVAESDITASAEAEGRRRANTQIRNTRKRLEQEAAPAPAPAPTQAEDSAKAADGLEKVGSSARKAGDDVKGVGTAFEETGESAEQAAGVAKKSLEELKAELASAEKELEEFKKKSDEYKESIENVHILQKALKEWNEMKRSSVAKGEDPYENAIAEITKLVRSGDMVKASAFYNIFQNAYHDKTTQFLDENGVSQNAKLVEIFKQVRKPFDEVQKNPNALISLLNEVNAKINETERRIEILKVDIAKASEASSKTKAEDLQENVDKIKNAISLNDVDSYDTLVKIQAFISEMVEQFKKGSIGVEDAVQNIKDKLAELKEESTSQQDGQIEENINRIRNAIASSDEMTPEMSEKMGAFIDDMVQKYRDGAVGVEDAIDRIKEKMSELVKADKIEQSYKTLLDAQEKLAHAEEIRERLVADSGQSPLIQERRRRAYDRVDSAKSVYEQAHSGFLSHFGSKEEAEAWSKQYDATHIREVAKQEEDAVSQSQSAIREEIKETNEIIEEQEAWFSKVYQANEEVVFKGRDKRKALKSLKQASQEYAEYLEDPYAFDNIEVAKRVLKYHNIGQHAQKIGLDQETISQYWKEISGSEVKERLKPFEEERSKRTYILSEAKERLQELVLEYNKQMIQDLQLELGTTVKKQTSAIGREIKAYETGFLESQGSDLFKAIIEDYSEKPKKTSADYIEAQILPEYEQLDEKGKSIIQGLIQAYSKLEMIKKDGGLEYLQMLKQEKEINEQILDAKEKIYNAQDAVRNGQGLDTDSMSSLKETIDSIVSKLQEIDPEKAKIYGIFGTSKHEAGSGNIQNQIQALLQLKSDIDSLVTQAHTQTPPPGQQQGASPAEEARETAKAEEKTGQEIDRNNQSLKERLEYLKQIRAESKFLETAEDKRIDMEDKGWDAGGNNPRATEAQSQKWIKQYEDHVEHMESAEELIKGFEDSYEQVIITLKNGEQVIVHSADELDGLSLALSKISDIKFVPIVEEDEQVSKVKEEYDSLVSEIKATNKEPLSLVDYKSIEEAQDGIQKLEEAIEKLKSFKANHADELELMGDTSQDLDAFITKLENTKKHYEGQLEQLDKKKRYGWMSDASSLEGYKDASQSFVTALAAEVAEGTKQYDEAMEELKEHIKQRTAELQAERERNLRVNTELMKFTTDAKPILDAMGIAEGGPLPSAYADFLDQIQQESIKAEDAVKQFAQAVGYAFDEASGKWAKKGVRSQEEIQQEIKETTRLIENQEEWLRYLSSINKENNIQGRRAATDELRSATSMLREYRTNPDNFVGQMDKERVVVRWWRAMQQAKSQGVADSVLERYRTDISEYDYTDALNKILKEIEYRQSVLQEANERMVQLQQELAQAQSQAIPQSINDVSSLDQLSEYIKQIDIAKASAEELKSILSKADEFGGLSSLPSDQVEELKSRMEELGIVMGREVTDDSEQMGSKVAADIEKVKAALIDLYSKFTSTNMKELKIRELLGLEDISDIELEKSLLDPFQIIKKILRNNYGLGDNVVSALVDKDENIPISEEAMQKMEKYREILHALGYEMGEITRNVDIISAPIIPTDSALKDINAMIEALLRFGVIKSNLSFTPVSEGAGTAAESVEEQSTAAERATHSTEEMGEAASRAAGQTRDLADANEQAAEAAENQRKAQEGLNDTTGSAPTTETGKEKPQTQKPETKTGETGNFTELEAVLDHINKLIEEKNELIVKEFGLVKANIPEEAEIFEKLSKAIQAIIDVLNNFQGNDSLNNITDLATSIAQLNLALDGLDDKDVFKNLNNIISADTKTLTNNLQAIRREFSNLKRIMNDFGDNGTTVFKSISDLATAGDQLVDKMSKLFEQSGVKMPDLAAKGKEAIAKGQSALAAKKPELNNTAQDISRILTPDSSGWKKLVEWAKQFGIEIANAEKIVYRMNGENEFYDFKFSNGKTARYDVATGEKVSSTSTIRDEQAATAAIEARKKVVKQLADSYLELAEMENKVSQSQIKDGTAKPAYVKRVEDIKARQKEYEEQLGVLTEEEQAIINRGKQFGEQEKSRFGFDTKDISEMKSVVKVYEELTNKLQTYYTILEKQQTGKMLTVSDTMFLQKYGEYFKQAGLDAESAGDKIEVFSEKTAEAAEAKSKFMVASQDVLSNFIEKNIDNLATQVGSLDFDESKPDTYKQKLLELEKIVEELRELAKNVKVDDQGSIDRFFAKFKEGIASLGEIKTGSQYSGIEGIAVSKLDRQMADWQNKNTRASQEYIDQVAEYRQLLNTSETQQQFDAVVQGFERTKAAAADAGSVGASFIDQLKSRIRSLGQYLLSFASFYRIVSVFRKALTVVKELDTALTEMRKVSDESLSTLEKYQFETFDMADKVGTTAKQIQQSTADWLRLGRTFEQSKVLAEQSTVLMNVSEFENIKDATEALVSATQAYDNLDSQAIIDKLNLIGNNFAVSTSDLAQGLQNAAAVLKTQGNDIDEALALLTAGNLIGQDISKASMGVRTISLRISGTEEAKDEIKDMGEDVDDFVVRTRSKTDQIIRDYTAVASNAYKGVSVLDANGNLRNTYDILLDISKIYEEIQREDKQRGTNRAQALIETLAGKTRSNIAASILLNGDILEQVYTASQEDYMGSAEKENQKYLESIEGRIARLQNRLQELAFTGLESGTLKPIIDFLTNAVQLATTLVDKIGLLPALIGSIGGAVLQFSGHGINNGFKGMLSGISGNKFIQRNFGYTKIDDTTQSLLSGAATDGWIDVGQMLDKNGVYYNQLSESGKEYFMTLKAMKTELISVGEAQRALGSISFDAISIFKGLGKVAAGFVSTLGTMAIAMAASALIQGGIKLISEKIIHRSENVIKAAEEAKSVMDSAKQSFDETKKSIGELSDEYARLSTGVEVKGSTIKNLNLSEEEFARYIEISNNLAELSPELVTGYTNQGDAIVNLGNTVEDVNSQFERYLDIQQQIVSGEFGKNLDAMWDGTVEQVSKYQAEIDGFNASIDSMISPDIFDVSGGVTDLVEENTRILSGVTMDLEEELTQAFLNAGVVFEKSINSETGLIDFLFGNGFQNIDQNKIEGINTILKKYGYINDSTTSSLKAQASKNQMLIQKAYMDQLPYIQEYIKGNSLFDMIDDDVYAESLRTGILQMMDNVDFSSIRKEVQDKGGLQSWIDDFISSFAVGGDKLKESFDGLLKLQEKRDKMSIEEYTAERMRYLLDIANDQSMINLGYDYNDLAKLFGFLVEDENGNFVLDDKQRTASAAQKLGIKDNADDLYRLMSQYSGEYFDNALYAVEQLPQSEVNRIAGSYKKIWAFLLPYLTGQAILEKEPGTDLLESVFNDKDFDTSKYTSKLQAVETALSSLFENGFLTDKEKVTLQEALPDLSDFDAESIKQAGGNVIKEYVNYIRNQAQKLDLTEDAQRNLDTYIQNLVSSYAESVQGQSWGQILNDAVFDTRTGQDAASRYGDIVASLGDRLQDSDAATIMLMLDADGTLANGTIYDIVKRWDEYKIQLGITLNDEDEARIQRELSHIETAQALNNAMISTAEANGGRASIGQRQQAYVLAQEASSRAEKYTQTKMDDYMKALAAPISNAGLIDSLWDEVLGARTDEEEKRQDELEALKAHLEAGANDLLEEEERLETEASVLQTQREREVKFDGQASEDTLKAIQKNDEDRQKNAEALADFFTTLAESDEGSVFSEEFLSTAADYLSKALGFESDAFDDAMQHHQNVLDNLSDDLSRVQAQAQATSDALSLAEAQGRETTASDYQRQIDDAEDQIAILIAQRREQLAIMSDLKGQEGTQAYKDAQAEVENLTSQIRQLQIEQVNAQKAIGEIPMLHLQADKTSLEEAAQVLEDELSDPRNAPTVSVYVNLITNADEQITNLEQQRAELLGKMAEAESRQGFSVYDTDYQEYRSNLAEVDSQIRQLTQSQLEWKQAILDMPIDEINRQLERYSQALAHLQAQRELSSVSGKVTTSDDYLREAKLYHDEANYYAGQAALQRIKAVKMMSEQGYAIDSEAVRAVYKEAADFDTQSIQAQKDALIAQKNADQVVLGLMESRISVLQQSATELNNAIEDAEARGQEVTALNYQRLISNADAQIEQNQELIDQYEALMRTYPSEFGSEDWKTWTDGINSAKDAIFELNQSKVEWREIMAQMTLTELQNEQADMEREMTVAQEKHRKISKRMYRELIKNGEKQIQSLRKQQSNYNKMSTKYREIEEQIADVESAMREWEDTANHLASAAGTNLASALTSALSEINSETGLTKETMDSLLESFSDLTSYDLSGLFYESADGMKLNIGMAQSLIDAQYELTMSDLQNTIAEQNKIIKENSGLQDENAQAAVAAAQLRKTAAEQEMSMYQALYNQQKEALSPYQAWQNATQTDNAGAKYEAYQGAWKGIQEAFTKGLTGTDDFRTYVAFFDRWGQDTVEAYKRNKDLITRYITEDSTGISNFIKDLVAKGYGTENDKGGYDVSLSDIDKIARDLGMSEDATRMMINRGEDYGWIVTMADTVQEGELKAIDTTHDLIQETMRLQEMMTNGATEDEIANQQKYVDELTGSVGHYIETVRQLEKDHGIITSSELETQYNTIKALQDLMGNKDVTKGMSNGELAKFKEDINAEIQRISDETGIPIYFNAELGEFVIDEDKLQQQFDGFKPKITVEEVTTKSFQEARKELMPPPSLDEATKQVLGVTENEVIGSTFDKLQNGWEENSETVGKYIEQLNNLNLSEEDIKNLQWLDFDDGGYTDGLEELETILDNIRDTFGITAEEGQYLIPILETLGLINVTGGKSWAKPISAIMGTDVDALNQWIQDTEGVDIDLNFDPTQMSVDELADKINELSQLEIDPEVNEAAYNQLRELITTLQTELGFRGHIKELSTQYGSIDEFLSQVETMSEEERQQIMIDIGINEDDWDAFIESAKRQSIEVKIEGALKDGKTVEDLLGMSDEELASELDIEADTETFRAAKEMLNDISMQPYKQAGETIVDQIVDRAYEAGTQIGQGFLDTVTGGGETTTTTYNETPDDTPTYSGVPLAENPTPVVQNSEVIQKTSTEISVIGAKESEQEVKEFFDSVQIIPEKKEVTIEQHIETMTSGTQPDDNHALRLQQSQQQPEQSGGGQNVSINVEVIGEEQVDQLNTAIQELEGKNVVVQALVAGTTPVNTLKNAIDELYGKTVNVVANVSDTTRVDALRNAINKLSNKEVTVTQKNITKNIEVKEYTGTVTGSPYVAHASGTAYNMLNLTPRTEANAAGNDVTIPKTGKSLVNELGRESIIRDGKWYLLPGGMHVETLKKGDIVLNHLQTDALLHNRIAPGTGDLYGKFEDVVDGAYAGGTLGRTLMSAYGSGGYVTIQTGGDLSHSTGIGGGGGDTKIYVNTPSNTKSTASTDKGSLDNFKKWLEKLFDWIEVRVERVRYQIDLWQQRAEYRNGYQNKNAAIDQAVKLIGELGVYNKKKKKFTGGSGLLQDMQSGAKRYYEQANLVRQKALENKLFTKNSKGESAAKQIDSIIKKIQEGTININEYNENVREFISAYKQWYDKGKDLQSQIEELKKQLKELEQTKLDNITEQFDSIIGYAEAVKSSSEATVDYYNMVGNEVNGTYTKNQITEQIKQQTSIVDQLGNEYAAYNKELSKAKKVFGANSNEYREAQTQLKGIQQAYVEARTALKELQETTARLDIQRIELYIDRLKDMGSRMSNVVSYGEARGTKYGEKNNPYLTEGRYQAQYNNNIKLMNQYQQEIDKQNKLIQKYGYQMGSEKYQEAFQAIEQAEQEILSLAATNEQLQNSINELRWKPFTDLQQKVKNTIADVDYLRGLMGEEEWFNKDATITNRGYANIALLGDSIKKTKQLTADYAKALDKIEEEYKKGTISLEEYNEKSREYVELIKSSVTETKNYEKALIDMYKTQITMENEILQDNINLRQKALQSKKNYYDYDKQIKEKSKDIITLQAQINALAGVTNQSAVAERKRLLAQLQEAQEDLKDTQLNHRYDTINQGYESLSEDAQRNLDDELEKLERNADEQEAVVNMMLEKIKTSYTEAYNGINSIIEQTGVNISDQVKGSVNSIHDLIEEINQLNDATTAINLATQAAKDASQYVASSQVSGINTAATKSTVKKSDGTLDTAVSSGAATGLTNAAAGTGTATANKQAETNANTNKSVTNPKTDLSYLEKAINLVAGWKTQKNKDLSNNHALFKYVYQGGKNKSRRKNVTMSLANELALGNKLDVKGLPKDASKLTSANKNAILKKLKEVGYASGTKYLDENDGSYWTHDGEIVIRKSDGAVLTPMSRGSAVIPANLAENLFKWGAIDPDKFISNPFLRKKEDVHTTTNEQAPTNIQIGSMFTIQGNVDADVMDRLDDLGRALTNNRSFQQNVVNLVTKEYVRESRKLGMR